MAKKKTWIAMSEHILPDYVSLSGSHPVVGDDWYGLEKSWQISACGSMSAELFEAIFGVKPPPYGLYFELTCAPNIRVVKVWGDTEIGLPNGWMWEENE